MHHMSPLMNFISQNPQYHSKNNCPTVTLNQEITRTNQQRHNDKWRHGICSAGIGLDKSMSYNVLGINMMHSETSNQSRTHNWCRKLPPSVTRPVQYPTRKVYHETRRYKSNHHRHRPTMVLSRTLDQPPPQIQGKRHIGTFESTFRVGIMIFPKILFLWRSLRS